MRTDFDSDGRRAGTAEEPSDSPLGFWTTVVHSAASLLELEARIIALQLLRIVRAAALRAVAALVGVAMLLAGAVFLYIAIFKLLRLTMPAIGVWLIFAAVHLLVGGLLLWRSAKRATRRPAGTTDRGVAATDSRSPGAPLRHSDSMEAAR